MIAHADDLLIASSVRNKDKIVAFSRPEVDKVVAWSDKARLRTNISRINTSKCETAFFNLASAEAARQPSITIDEKRLSSNPFPVFLGVTIGEHVRKLCQLTPGQYQPPQCSGRRDLGTANIGLSSGLHCDCA